MTSFRPHPSPLPLLPLVLDNVPRGLRQALAQEGVPFVEHRPGPAAGRFLLVDSRAGESRTPAPGQTALDVHPLRQGFDEDPFQALVDQRSACFQWQIAEFELIEEIARVDKRAVRRRLLEALREKIAQRGGVWVRVAPFPFPYRSAFNFRLDYDHYDPADFATTLEALAGHEQATSHYLCGSAYASGGEALARLRGLDVGSHGYWHHTYRTVDENLRNLRRGIDVLRTAGLEPSGFVAPHGRFNRALLVALETLGIRYSSEFALAYDELPFEVGTAGVLQIPIHPICLELFVEAAKRTTEASSPDAKLATAVHAAADYLQHLAQVKYRLGEPVFFYGHPTGRSGGLTHVLHEVFAAVAGFGAIWQTTLRQFHDWWRVRSRICVTVTSQHGELVVAAEGLPPDYRVGIECVRGKHVALVPLERPVVRFSPEALAYESRTAEPTIVPLEIGCPGGLRGHVRRLLDWEKVTPVDEIPACTWRNWAKRTLRRWWKA